jgi:SAM-dependent methyltransferase
MHVGDAGTFTFLKCKKCEAVYLQNRINADTLINFYTDAYLPYRGASAWGAYASFVERDQQQTDFARVETCRKHVRLNASSKVLDLGCGRPTFLQALYKKTACLATGIDFTNSGWHDAEWPGLQLIEKDPTNFQPEDSYDLITAWHYMEHDYNPRKTVQNVAKWLAPGGKIIIEVPDYQSLTRRLQGSFWEGWHAPRHTILYSEKSFREMLPEAEWHISNYYRFGTLDPFTLWWMGLQEKRKIDWAASMQKHFLRLVALKIATMPLFVFKKWIPFGIQTVVATRR